MKSPKRKAQAAASVPSSPLYFFGGIGALIYYIQLANGFWEVVLAFLKAIVWPAFLVYDVLKFIR